MNPFIAPPVAKRAMRVSGHKRKGMSEVVVTFFLLVVSLITCVMVGGFSFGLIGDYVGPAEVSVQNATCSQSANLTTCQLTLMNQGAHSTATSGDCLIRGASVASVVGGGTVPAGGSLGVQCIAHGGNFTEGARIQGALSLTNGGVLYFFGTVA